MSDHPETRSDTERELLDLYEKADPGTKAAFAAAIKGGKLNITEVLSMLSNIMNDPNVESIIESMKKLFGDGRNRNSETMQQLLAFTIFYSSSIYAMLLCFLYWKWHNDANAEQPEDADAPADTE